MDAHAVAMTSATSIPPRIGMLSSLILAGLVMAASLILMPPGLLNLAGPAAMLPLCAGLLGVLAGVLGMRAARGHDRIEAALLEAAFGPRAWSNAIDDLRGMVLDQQQASLAMAAQHQRLLEDAQQAGARFTRQAADVEQRLLAAVSRAERGLQAVAASASQQGPDITDTAQAVAELSQFVRSVVESRSSSAERPEFSATDAATAALRAASDALANQTGAMADRAADLQQEAASLARAGREAVEEVAQAASQLAALSSDVQGAAQAMPETVAKLSAAASEGASGIARMSAELRAETDAVQQAARSFSCMVADQQQTAQASHDRLEDFMTRLQNLGADEAAAREAAIIGLNTARSHVEHAHVASASQASEAREQMAALASLVQALPLAVSRIDVAGQEAVRTIEDAAARCGAHWQSASLALHESVQTYGERLIAQSTTLQAVTDEIGGQLRGFAGELALVRSATADTLREAAAALADQSQIVTSALHAAGKQAMQAARVTLRALPRIAASTAATNQCAAEALAQQANGLSAMIDRSGRDLEDRLRIVLHQIEDAHERRAQGIAALHDAIPQAALSIRASADQAAARLYETLDVARGEMYAMAAGYAGQTATLASHASQFETMLVEAATTIRRSVNMLTDDAHLLGSEMHAAAARLAHTASDIKVETQALGDVRDGIVVAEHGLSTHVRQFGDLASQLRQDLAPLTDLRLRLTDIEDGLAARSNEVLPLSEANLSQVWHDIADATQTLRSACAREETASRCVMETMDRVQDACVRLVSTASEAFVRLQGQGDSAPDGKRHDVTPAQAPFDQLEKVTFETERLRAQAESLAEMILAQNSADAPDWLRTRIPDILGILETNIAQMRSASTAFALASDGLIGCKTMRRA